MSVGSKGVAADGLWILGQVAVDCARIALNWLPVVISKDVVVITNPPDYSLTPNLIVFVAHDKEKVFSRFAPLNSVCF